MKLPKGLRAATLTIASFGLVTTGLAVAGPTYADGSGSTVVIETDPDKAIPVSPIIPGLPNPQQTLPGVPNPQQTIPGVPNPQATLTATAATAGIGDSVTFSVANATSALSAWTLYSNGSPAAVAAWKCTLGGACLPTFVFPVGNIATTLSLTATSDQGQTTQAVSLTVTQVNTSTVITAPNTGQVGQPTKISSTVTSSGGSTYVPSGVLTVEDSSGAVIHQGVLTPGPGKGQAYMYFNFTPTAPGTYIFTAKYTENGQSVGSNSAPDTLNVAASYSPISLAVPPNLSVNTPIVLRASLVPSSTQGTVGFTANGAAISAAVPIVNGTASFNWTPNIQGKVTLGANYTTNNGGSGATTDVVTIGAPTATDVITLIQPGWGTWGNGTAHVLGNGSNFPFAATTLSGAGVTLSETGPCTVSGLTLKVNEGSGVCNMTASTPGGNGYQGVSFAYTINLVPGTQSATLNAPVSGRYKVKKVLVLETASEQNTSAGKTISWRLKKKGRSNCKIMNRDSGAVTLKILKKGTCTVLGRAPGVSGEWNTFKTARKYTGR